jgi:hypothetical protein
MTDSTSPRRGIKLFATVTAPSGSKLWLGWWIMKPLGLIARRRQARAKSCAGGAE